MGAKLSTLLCAEAAVNRSQELLRKPESGPGESAGQTGQRRTGGFGCLTVGWRLDMAGFMPRAMRADRLLSELRP